MITGKLVADFEDFVAGAQSALDNLKAMEGASKDLEKSLDAATKVKPDNVREFATETKKVNAEVEATDRIMAQLQGKVATAFSVAAVAAFVGKTVEAASEISRLAAATQLTAGEIQELQYIAVQTNTPLNVLVSAVQNLQQGVGTKNAGLVAAVAGLNLQWEEFAALGANEQMYVLAGALNDVESATKKAELAEQAFGRQWKQVIAAASADLQQLAAEAPKVADANIEGLNRLEARWNLLVANVKAGSIDVLGGVARAMESQVLSPAGGGDTGMRELGLASGLPEITGDARDYIAAVRELPAQLGKVTVSTAEWKAEQIAMDAELKVATERVAEQERAQQAWDAAIVELNSVGLTWKDTLNKMNVETIEGIKWGTEAGLSQQTLATLFGVTDGEMKAVTLSMAEAKKVAQDYAAAQKDIAAFQAASGRAINQSILDYDAYIQKTLEADTTSRSYYEKMARDATEAYNVALAGGDKVTTTRLEQLRVESEKAQEALANWSRYATQSFDDVNSAAKKTGDELDKVSQKVEAATQGMASFIGQSFPSSESLTRAAQVPGSMLGFGGGEGFSTYAPPDLLQAWTNRVAARAPVSSFVAAPMAATGVNMYAGAVQMNYPIMNDPAAMDQIGRVVGDAIMSRVTRTGTRV